MYNDYGHAAVVSRADLETLLQPLLQIDNDGAEVVLVGHGTGNDRKWLTESDPVEILKPFWPGMIDTQE